jgi:LysM repeat protein
LTASVQWTTKTEREYFKERTTEMAMAMLRPSRLVQMAISLLIWSQQVLFNFSFVSVSYELAIVGAQGVSHPPSNRSAYRTLFPFFLLIAVVLLLLWRFLTPSAPPPLCPTKSAPYRVKGGDTCWDVAKTYGCSVDVIKELNPKLDCDNLKRGDQMCLPLPEGL